jgi:tRNA-2-methylthio-N6-dimethylallyladenosine synthase
MKRRYTAGQVEHALKSLTSITTAPTFISHFIIGFPDETEEDFQETLYFAKKNYFDFYYIYKYLEAYPSEAANYPRKISLLTKNLRYLRFYGNFRQKMLPT